MPDDWGDLTHATAVPEEPRQQEDDCALAEQLLVDKRRAAARKAADDGLVAHPESIQAQTIHEDPKMVHFMNFISPEEAAHLIELAESRWARSTVTRGSPKDMLGEKGCKEKSESADNCEADVKPAEGCKDKTESADNCEAVVKPAEVVSKGCTSWTVRLDHEESTVVERILARVASVTGHPLENVEPLVLVRYAEGEVFRLHHDGAMRPMTVFTYLNDVAEGAETQFPYLGLAVQPVTGTAVMWANTIDGKGGPDAVADMRMMHEALPPGKGCIKYAMNCFVNGEQQRDCSHIQMVTYTAQAGA